MSRKYSREVYEFVRSNISGVRMFEMAKMVNDKFGLNISESQIKSYCSRYKLKNGLFHKSENTRPFTIFTDEQLDFIHANYVGIGNQTLADLINEKFKTSFTRQQIKTYKHKHKLDSGLNGQFVKGSIPANKGQKMSAYTYEKCKATMFQKGNRPHNYKPIGSERIESKDGYTLIKIADPNKWELKHVHIWEQANGKVPKGSMITFLDGNKSNFALNNLACITQAECAALNKNKMRSEFAEITQANINLVRLNKKIKDIKKDKKGDK